MDKEKYQKYINNFRRRLTPFLRPGVGLACSVYPSRDGGAVLEFLIGNASENDDDYGETNGSLGKALSKIKQKAFGGNLDGFVFGGTNTILEDNRIIYIKDSDEKEWDDSAAKRDVEALIESSRRTAR